MAEYIRADELKALVDGLADAPAGALVPVRYGHWQRGKYVPGYMFADCSECGYEAVMEDEDIFKYCPDCGARMDGDKNG